MSKSISAASKTLPHLPTIVNRLEDLESQVEALAKKVKFLDKFTTDIHLELQTSINVVANRVSDVEGNPQSNMQSQINQLRDTVNGLVTQVAFLMSRG